MRMAKALNTLKIFLDKKKNIIYHVLVFSELVSYNRLRADSGAPPNLTEYKLESALTINNLDASLQRSQGGGGHSLCSQVQKI